MKKQQLDKPNFSDDEYSETSSNTENVSVGAESTSIIKSNLVPSSQKQELKLKSNNVLMVVSLQIIVLIFMILLTSQYSWLHNVPHPLSPIFGNKDIGTFADSIANYNFVGVKSPEDKPSIFAVVLEVAIWSLAGVLARSEYYLSQIIVRKRQFLF